MWCSIAIDGVGAISNGNSWLWSGRSDAGSLAMQLRRGAGGHVGIRPLNSLMA